MAVITWCVAFVGPGGVCHVYADGGSITPAGGFSVRLRAFGKVSNFQNLFFNGTVFILAYKCVFNSQI